MFIVNDERTNDECARDFLSIFDFERQLSVWNSSNTITVNGYVKNDLPERFKFPADFQIKAQLIKTRFQSREQLLETFDLDSAAIGIMYRKPVSTAKTTSRGEFNLFWTERFALALKTNTNIIRPGKRDGSYISRIVKYSKRGFRPLIPGGFVGLEHAVTAGLTDVNYPRGGLAELVHAMYHSDYKNISSRYESRKRIVFRLHMPGYQYYKVLDHDLSLLYRQLTGVQLVVMVLHTVGFLDNWRVADSTLRTLSEGIIKTDFYSSN